MLQKGPRSAPSAVCRKLRRPLARIAAARDSPGYAVKFSPSSSNETDSGRSTPRSSRCANASDDVEVGKPVRTVRVDPGLAATGEDKLAHTARVGRSQREARAARRDEEAWAPPQFAEEG